MAGRLEGIPAIGAKQDGAPARPEHSNHLAGGRTIVGHMLDHFMRQHGIERGIGIWQMLAGRHVNLLDAGLPSFDHSIEVDVQSSGVVA